jgi:hypothetical protein
MSSVIVNPIARPAIEAKVPRGSAAHANITQTRKNVSTASITTAEPAPIPFPTAGAPRLTTSTWLCGSSHVSMNAASTAAMSCANQ